MTDVLKPCPKCGELPVRRNLEHGGFQLRCPGRRRPHIVVGAVTLTGLEHRWNQEVDRLEDTRWHDASKKMRGARKP
jgi:hypothetical protein